MKIRSFRPEDATSLVALSMACTRSESDFVLNPAWECEEDVFADFARHRIAPAEHLLVADAGGGQLCGFVGFLREPEGLTAGLYVPIVAREERGHGVGGELLRAALAHGADVLGLKLVSAAIGTRNHAGYTLLASTGFRPVRQHLLMRCDAAPKATMPALAGLEVTRAGPEHAPGILAVYEACGFEPRSLEAEEALLLDPLRPTLVASLEGRVVGFVELETHLRRRIWVAYVGVSTDMRDRGLGSALVARALEQQFASGAQQALLLLSPANRTALRAYENAGFRRHRVIDVLERGL